MRARLVAVPLAIAIMLGACASTPHAASAQPKGYIVAEMAVRDEAAYRDYAAAVTAIVRDFGGIYLVRGGALDPREGAPPAERVVIIEFPDVATARAFYESSSYGAIAPLRARAAESRVYIVTGLAAR